MLIKREMIGSELRNEIDGMMQPGDVIISRKNWYLSNIGLPGFWPHAAFYLGEADELEAKGLPP